MVEVRPCSWLLVGEVVQERVHSHCVQTVKSIIPVALGIESNVNLEISPNCMFNVQLKHCGYHDSCP